MRGNMALSKKGGIDTIVAYIVCSLPLIYILIFLISIFIHFTVQMYIGQVLKEALVLTTTKGELSEDILLWMDENLNRVGDYQYLIKRVKYDTETSTFLEPEYSSSAGDGLDILNGEVPPALVWSPEYPERRLSKGDVIAIRIKSKEPSLMSRISNFSILGGAKPVSSDAYYFSTREGVVQYDITSS